MKNLITKAALVAVFMCSPYFIQHSMADYYYGGGGTDCGPGGGATAPLDGGLSLLAIAGVGYGVKRFRRHKEKNDEMSSN